MIGIRVVILAAGQGKRMCSQLAKVLHQLVGKSLLEHVVEAAHQCSTRAAIIIYGHQGKQVRNSLSQLDAIWVEQTHQLGTGHALQQALPEITQEERVLVLYGDVPLISVNTLKNLIKTTPEQAIGMITAITPNPTGFGRIIRDAKHNIIQIIEEKDATEQQKNISEINSGIYLIPANYLSKWLPALNNQNTQKEYYLTDIIGLAAKENIAIHSIQPTHYQEILGVNNRMQLAELERFYQRNYAEKLMLNGVTLRDPNRLDIRGELEIGQDTIMDINIIIEGKVKIGNNCMIGANTILRNVIIGNHVEIKANSIIDGADISDHCAIGPFARIRPGTKIGIHSHVGNFVEIKNSIINTKTKISHLSYIGDSEVGNNVNIGAGTITCNYDGVNKHKTTIGDHVFIGSNTQLVAPVTIGEGATIGAGSTISRNAPANQLTLSRAEQRSIPGWQRPTKKAENKIKIKES